MIDAMKTYAAPLRKTIGWVLAALVLIWFWTPTMTWIVDVATKAKGLFGK